MNFPDWYTDLMDIYRVVPVKDGNLTRNERQKIYSSVPCRIYKSDNKALNMSQQAASYNETDKLMCSNSVDVRAGDELIITRGGRLGHTAETLRAYPDNPTHYYEPFGAVIPGLAHQEMAILRQERVTLNESETESSTAAEN